MIVILLLTVFSRIYQDCLPPSLKNILSPKFSVDRALMADIVANLAIATKWI